jgi:hypothetical protein
MPYYVYYPMPSMDEGPKLKEPDIFMGKDANKLTPFLTQCIQWFIARPRKFQSQQDHVIFVASYL